jgi:hypothetical protein
MASSIGRRSLDLLRKMPRLVVACTHFKQAIRKPRGDLSV